ncbi:MAG: hypothetical protein H0X38_14190 [Planctomycetes bacterium]|nr:hypothetical protein [Planctomycetota bacterium]
MYLHHPRRHPLVAFIVCGFFAATTASAAEGGGLGISPGIILIEDAPPGVKLDLGAQGLNIQVSNDAGTEMDFDLVAIVPGPDEIGAYEAGYEPLPDASWVHIEHEHVTVPAHGTAHSGITLDIPARAELANRHFMLYVEAGPKPTAALGAVLRVRARVLLETATDAHPGALEHAAGIALAPGRVEMVPHGDGGWSGEVEITNHADHPATYDLLTLRQVYGAGEEERRDRFFGARQTGLLDQDWAIPDTASFTLAPGATRLLHLAAKPARALKADEQVDEVLFLARRAGPGIPAKQRRRLAGADYERSELIRLRYSAPPAATKP